MRPNVSNMRLGDGRQIPLGGQSVLAVVGPNNSGKTHFLRSVVAQLHGTTVDEVQPRGGLIEAIEVSWTDDGHTFDELRDRARNSFMEDALGNLQVHNGVTYPGGNSFRPESIESLPGRTVDLGVYADLFVQFDDAVQRVGETEPKKLATPGGYEKLSLVQRARESEVATGAIRHYFRGIFGSDVSYYDRGSGDIGFILASEVEDGAKVGGPLTERTKGHMEASPKLWLQGLGMRSVLGLLLRIFALDQPILILDEPEAFLHPPQSSALGAVLCEIARKYDRQIILSTHDRHILQGLTREGAHEVHIERLDQSDGTRTSVSVPVAALATARATSLVRFSPLLDALFTKVTVLVENETDAFFYSALLEEYARAENLRHRGLSPEDFFYLGVGGKAALGRTAGLVRTLRASVLVIADFDLIFSLSDITTIVNELAADSRPKLEQLYASFLGAVDTFAAKESTGRNDVLKRLKHEGLNFDEEDIRTGAKNLLNALGRMGVFVCQVGELEDFDSDLKERVGKAEWVRSALANDVHKSNESLEFAARIMAGISAS